MDIRLKLFAPTLVLIAVIFAVVHFSWLPHYLELDRQSYIRQENNYIELLGAAITTGMTTNDIAEVHDIINKVLMHRRYWYSVTVYNKDGIRVYPVTARKEPERTLLRDFQHTILYEGRNIGNMHIQVDIDSMVEKNTLMIESLEELLLAVVLVVSLAATFLQEVWIRKPVHQLLGLAKSLSEGKYDAALTYESHDELGDLVTSFRDMREKIKRREKELRETQMKLKVANAMLRRASITDAVTRIPNRRHFNEVLVREISRNSRLGKPLTLILCDIDFFKQYNDTYGHSRGDACLRIVAKTIHKLFARSQDEVARYGGEEFAVILPDADEQHAREMAAKIQHCIERLELPHATSRVADHVTVSVGVTSLVPDKYTNMTSMIEKADRALYMAKKQGRNQVQVA